ncbi:MAG: serine/threonine protein kinase [Bacteroidales bacterium]|nr:serine/threonine protein kinase [Bacteroidales bacterium]
MMTLKEGEVINGRYRLVSERGRGTFGEVWQAWDDILDMEVALKIYIALDTRGINEFKSEFRTAFNLNHPNLLHASHFDVVEKRPYLVMPYCPLSANELIGRITEEDAWKFIKDVSAGLAYLHSKDIIHRDIKPDNILRDPQGDFLISDFGVSVKMRSTLRRNSVRDLSESTTQGTIGYMGPEMFSSDASAVKATDIWALGATMYELLEGELPFFGQGGVIQLHGGETPDLKGQWSDSLKSTVAACLSKDTWERPKADDLDWYASDVLSGRSVYLPWEDAWRRKREEDERLRAEAERRRKLEEQRAEEARQKAIEEERRRREEQRLREEAEKRQKEEAARKAAEEERRRKEEEERARKEAARKAAEEERKRKEEEERTRKEAARKAAEEARKAKEAEKAKRIEVAKAAKAAKAARAAAATKEKGTGISGLIMLSIALLAAAGVLFVWKPWNNKGIVKESVQAIDESEGIVDHNVLEPADTQQTVPAEIVQDSSQNEKTAIKEKPSGQNKEEDRLAKEKKEKEAAAEKARLEKAENDNTLEAAINRNDWTRVKQLADAGDQEACYRYAQYCYIATDYDSAHAYAQKAGQAKGTPVVVKLRKEGYYEEDVVDPGWK